MFIFLLNRNFKIEKKNDEEEERNIMILHLKIQKKINVVTVKKIFK
jgi:hypothetical protein